MKMPRTEDVVYFLMECPRRMLFSFLYVLVYWLIVIRGLIFILISELKFQTNGGLYKILKYLLPPGQYGR